VIIDTSVWVDHLRRGNPRLVDLLESGLAMTHPFVVGELACVNINNRAEFLGLVGALPVTTVADHDEVLRLVAAEHLHGRGIGWIDLHLLASARLSHTRLWTLDRRLRQAAEDLALAG
jgi:predicted nucleic acid-binding protein